ncbi:hypothetical protein MGSAQ_003055, partial [marine sediment metagenome]
MLIIIKIDNADYFEHKVYKWCFIVFEI